MAGEITSSYNTTVVQGKEKFYPQEENFSQGENVIMLKKFEKVIRGRWNGKYEITSRTRIGKKLWVPLNLNSAKMLAHKRDHALNISMFLSFIGVPREERAGVVQKIFEVIDMAVSPEWPVSVDIEWLVVEGNETPSSCAICLEDFAEREEGITSLPCAHRYHQKWIDAWLEEEEEGITSLPYAHRYHQKCIDAWLIINPLCPLCRHPMPSKIQKLNFVRHPFLLALILIRSICLRIEII
ncbi:hypothetical protein ACLB2K_002852 [Fragaria x ananassa]